MADQEGDSTPRSSFSSDEDNVFTGPEVEDKEEEEENVSHLSLSDVITFFSTCVDTLGMRLDAPVLRPNPESKRTLFQAYSLGKSEHLGNLSFPPSEKVRKWSLHVLHLYLRDYQEAQYRVYEKYQHRKELYAAFQWINDIRQLMLIQMYYFYQPKQDISFDILQIIQDICLYHYSPYLLSGQTDQYELAYLHLSSEHCGVLSTAVRWLSLSIPGVYNDRIHHPNKEKLKQTVELLDAVTDKDPAEHVDRFLNRYYDEIQPPNIPYLRITTGYLLADNRYYANQLTRLIACMHAGLTGTTYRDEELSQNCLHDFIVTGEIAGAFSSFSSDSMQYQRMVHKAKDTETSTEGLFEELKQSLQRLETARRSMDETSRSLHERTIEILHESMRMTLAICYRLDSQNRHISFGSAFRRLDRLTNQIRHYISAYRRQYPIQFSICIIFMVGHSFYHLLHNVTQLGEFMEVVPAEAQPYFSRLTFDHFLSRLLYPLIENFLGESVDEHVAQEHSGYFQLLASALLRKFTEAVNGFSSSLSAYLGFPHVPTDTETPALPSPPDVAGMLPPSSSSSLRGDPHMSMELVHYAWEQSASVVDLFWRTLIAYIEQIRGTAEEEESSTRLYELLSSQIDSGQADQAWQMFQQTVHTVRSVLEPFAHAAEESLSRLHEGFSQHSSLSVPEKEAKTWYKGLQLLQRMVLPAQMRELMGDEEDAPEFAQGGKQQGGPLTVTKPYTPSYSKSVRLHSSSGQDDQSHSPHHVQYGTQRYQDVLRDVYMTESALRAHERSPSHAYQGISRRRMMESAAQSLLHYIRGASPFGHSRPAVDFPRTVISSSSSSALTRCPAAAAVLSLLLRLPAWVGYCEAFNVPHGVTASIAHLYSRMAEAQYKAHYRKTVISYPSDLFPYVEDTATHVVDIIQSLVETTQAQIQEAYVPSSDAPYSIVTPFSLSSIYVTPDVLAEAAPTKQSWTLPDTGCVDIPRTSVYVSPLQLASRRLNRAPCILLADIYPNAEQQTAAEGYNLFLPRALSIDEYAGTDEPSDEMSYVDEHGGWISYTYVLRGGIACIYSESFQTFQYVTLLRNTVTDLQMECVIINSCNDDHDTRQIFANVPHKSGYSYFDQAIPFHIVAYERQ